jgi:hypothetical protein
MIQYLWSEGMEISEIYRRMTVQYSDNCMSQKKILRMGGKIQKRAEKYCSVMPSTVTWVEVTEYMNQRIRDNRRISNDEIESQTSISHGNKKWQAGLLPESKIYSSAV